MVMVHVYHALPGDARWKRRDGREDSGLRHIVFSRADRGGLDETDVSRSRLRVRILVTRACEAGGGKENCLDCRAAREDVFVS